MKLPALLLNLVFVFGLASTAADANLRRLEDLDDDVSAAISSIIGEMRTKVEEGYSELKEGIAAAKALESASSSDEVDEGILHILTTAEKELITLFKFMAGKVDELNELKTDSDDKETIAAIESGVMDTYCDIAGELKKAKQMELEVGADDSDDMEQLALLEEELEKAEGYVAERLADLDLAEDAMNE